MAGRKQAPARHDTDAGASPDLRPAPRRVDLHGDGLIRVGARPNLWQYLKQIWAFRHFVIYDSHARVATSNTSDSLGRLWMIMNPVLLGFAFFLVFGLLLQTSRGISNFIGYLIIGVFMFRFATQAIGNGSQSITKNQNVVHAFNFPRACLPLATNLRELFAQIPTLLVMTVLVYTLGDLPLPGSEPDPIDLSWRWLAIFPVLVLMVMMTTGFSLLLARAVATFDDVKHLISFGTRIWMYASCVFFSSERWERIGGDTALLILHLNPMYCVLDIVRQAWLYDAWADPMRWYVLGGWAFGLCLIGMLAFWQAEETYGRER
ncbi:MAG: ABC transporter permease [Nesterenkonia sp.]|uniref:ABC transporter permease n=1 Tax=Nesterenkonia marinintestina TaxID=2979865 RepID=UPI0021BFC94A|nr:ABC transporter permease [Nesterenkonia sp. GX14115]MDO5492034.1 ABC transporter permease [Nesterenkonia sp.]